MAWVYVEYAQAKIYWKSIAVGSYGAGRRLYVLLVRRQVNTESYSILEKHHPQNRWVNQGPLASGRELSNDE